MNQLLFADGLWDVIVPIGFVVFWIVASIFRGINEAKATAPKRAPNLPAERRPDPRKELERFLDELGANKPTQAAPSAETKPISIELPRAVRPTSPPLVQTQRAQKTVKSPKVGREPIEPKIAVRDRHLESRIGARRTEEMHSSLENQHIEMTVGSGPGLAPHMIAGDVGMGAKSIHAAPVGFGLGLPLGKNELARAFVLSTVFGPPRAFDEI